MTTCGGATTVVSGEVKSEMVVPSSTDMVLANFVPAGVVGLTCVTRRTCTVSSGPTSTVPSRSPLTSVRTVGSTSAYSTVAVRLPVLTKLSV